MKENKLKHLNSVGLLLILIATACTNQPKVIEADVQNVSIPFEFSEVPDANKITFEAKETASPNTYHKVTVKEILPTTKYVYLYVTEGSQTYWIATKKMEAEIGAVYYYRNGLLKTNFQSKEYNRTFEKLYLVSTIVPETHGTSTEKKDIEMHAFEGVESENSAMYEIDDKRIIPIAELVKNKAQLAGKQVTLKGTCTKVNEKIMGRNWIHLKDGSMDGYDLVITTKQEVVVGQDVTMAGTVSLAKDFGSGYFYELLIENGAIISN